MWPFLYWSFFTMERIISKIDYVPITWHFLEKKMRQESCLLQYIAWVHLWSNLNRSWSWVTIFVLIIFQLWRMISKRDYIPITSCLFLFLARLQDIFLKNEASKLLFVTIHSSGNGCIFEAHTKWWCRDHIFVLNFFFFGE